MIQKTFIDGLLIVPHEIARDRRGSFVKIFRTDHEPFAERIESFAESYYSVSERAVVRGLHFQVPPYDHEKLVTCIAGTVFDCVVDLRKSSATFGEAFHCTLEEGQSILVPRGCAHGFCATSDSATLLYHVTTVHAPQHDAGIHWTSANVPWPVTDPVLSARDAQLPHQRDYESPFV